jgi:hypothetical protein
VEGVELGEVDGRGDSLAITKHTLGGHGPSYDVTFLFYFICINKHTRGWILSKNKYKNK